MTGLAVETNNTVIISGGGAKVVNRQDGTTIVKTKIVPELLWLLWYGKWFGVAALLYTVCVSISISGRNRVRFRIMSEFFNSLPRNFAGCFKGWNIGWQLIAIGLSIVLVTSGFDWFYLSVTRNPRLLSWIEPATYLGVWVPLSIPPLLLLAGLVFKKTTITLTGWVLAQAALIGFALTELFKAITGRPHPPYHLEFVRSNPSHVFHFGLSPGWNYSTQPVTESDTSHIFHFGFLRSEIVSGWPSGHTLIAFAMSVSLFWLFPQKKWLGAMAMLYALYIGIGVSMTIHWFTDFASGIIFGNIVGITVGRSFATLKFKDELGLNPT